MENKFDVVVIGGGVIGSAAARALARYNCSVAVLEKNMDVCYETSGRNSAVVHGGFAYDTGSLKAKFCVEGNRGMDRLSKELDFPFNRCGKVLVGQSQEDLEQLERTMAQGGRNGATGLSLIDEEELHRLVPMAVGKFAMFSANSGILDPFRYTVAIAENAAMNGAEYFLEHEVTSLKRSGGLWTIGTNRETFYAKWVVNAAGLGAGRISEMLGIPGYKIIGSKGDYIILDKSTGPLLPMPVYPVPSNTYMGIHVTNTIDGNVIVGPNADLVDDFSYYGVPQENIDFLAESASRIWPCIHKKDYIRNYSGILPKWVDDEGVIQDFKIEVRDDLSVVNLIGIESPGLTAAVPIGSYVASQIEEREGWRENPEFNPGRKGIVRFANLSDEEKEALIKSDPDYGELVCRCENVTRAELIQAIHNPLGVKSVTGIKYRTRAMMGRCQGGYCQMRLTSLMMQELGLKKEEIRYNREGSYMFTSGVRGGGE